MSTNIFFFLITYSVQWQSEIAVCQHWQQVQPQKLDVSDACSVRVYKTNHQLTMKQLQIQISYYTLILHIFIQLQQIKLRQNSLQCLFSYANNQNILGDEQFIQTYLSGVILYHLLLW